MLLIKCGFNRRSLKVYNELMKNGIISLFILLLLQACSPQSHRPPESGDPQAKAKQLLNEAQYQLAIEEYARLIKAYPDKSIYYRLKTAEALIPANRLDEADELLKAVTPKPENNHDVALKIILTARLALKKDKLERAFSILSEDLPEATPAYIYAQRHEIRALIYERQLNFINAVKERLKFNDYLNDHRSIEDNSLRIWENLSKIEIATLEESRLTGPRGLSSWIELAIINRTLITNPTVLRRSLRSWQDEYPSHPANFTITERLLVNSRIYNLQPQQIALLLPFKGPYAKVSEAIRDGFLTAWHHSDEHKPLIKFYDANALNIEQLYLRAVDEGADFVVGPLQKAAIKKLTESQNLPITTLALNHLQSGLEQVSINEDAVLPNLIQFGLSPEDEARQIAEKAFFDGHNKALIITPNDEWGQRLYAAFSEVWLMLGGAILEWIHYAPKTRDYSNPVKRLLNIDRSEYRARLLRQKLNRKLESESRLRQDADLIVMAAPPLSARQIVPQFRFHKAENIPVYATSHIFTGNINQQADVDMNGVMFTDIPWILHEGDQGASIQSVVNDNFRAYESAYRRLYALGVDAFNLIPHLSRLMLQENTGFSGQTGELSISKEGVISRKLLWGKMINGKPVLLKAP